MDRERHEQVKAVFLAARETAREQRTELLDDRCGADAALRQEVESLLHHDEVVRQGAFDHAGTAAGFFGATVGDRISHFQIQRVVGVGGMGIVYEALQEQPRRTVALKVLRRGIATEPVLRRFKHEAEILGKLQHPGIAQIYEAGVHTDGAVPQPYFAMEFIAVGRPITDYVKEEELSLRKRLELFTQVCDAIHHGHEQGVIHRDLKPGNVLINAEGQPKVIDFGVARSTNADMAVTTLQTDVGELIGTLQYMSPEQCAGAPDDLDRRTDVYALGVILYQLLCDQLPYDLSKIPMLEAMRTIREQDPSHPSTIDRVLRGDVETIVLRALRKDREERYQSAAALADDIRRYLRAEPIVARAPTLWYQARMFARRHRPLVAAAVAVLLLMMVSVSVVTFLLTRWQTSERHAEITSNVIKAVEARLCDAGPYSESSRALIYVLDDHEKTSHGGRTLILLPHPGGMLYHVCFYVDAAGNEVYDFKPKMERIDHPELARWPQTGGVLLRGAIVGDLLPGHPGNEVAVALCDQHYSPCVIQIWELGLTGEPLAELWSLGHAQAMCWNDERGVLLVVARANSLPEFEPRLERWHEIETIKSGAPCVLYAWRPQLGTQVLPPLAGTDTATEA
ncbi:MAG: serine/threonine-protein kinase, partial [Phycisphaerales bacterium JB038]